MKALLFIASLFSLSSMAATKLVRRVDTKQVLMSITLPPEKATQQNFERAIQGMILRGDKIGEDPESGEPIYQEIPLELVDPS